MIRESQATRNERRALRMNSKSCVLACSSHSLDSNDQVEDRWFEMAQARSTIRDLSHLRLGVAQNQRHQIGIVDVEG